jgi:transposase
VFAASRSRRGDKGRNDRKFLEALHYFVVHNITWRALPEKFGRWNSVWKRFWRLSRSGTFEAFFDALAAMSETAHRGGTWSAMQVSNVLQRAQTRA